MRAVPVHFPLPNEVRPNERINSSSVHASSMKLDMSVVKCLTVSVLVLSSSSDAAFVKKYLEAKLLAQMLNNAQIPDSSMMNAYSMLQKPEESFAQMALPWKMKSAPNTEWNAAHQMHLYGPGHFTEHPVDGHHHHDHSHFDFPSEEELRAVMMKPPRGAMMMKPPKEVMMMKDPSMPSLMEPMGGMVSPMTPSNADQSWKYTSQRNVLPSDEKQAMSESELESLVAKMKQINKDIDEVSDDQMRQMITRGLSSKLPEDTEHPSADHPNESDMDLMNIMKPIDRFTDTGKGSNDSAAKENAAVTPKPEMLKQKPYMLPRYPTPIPPARFSISQMPTQQGLMSRMPQAFRSAMSSFGFGTQRRSPTGWNTPIGMNSIAGQRFYPYPPLAPINSDMQQAFEALMQPKRYRSRSKEANPAYLGAINQNRGTVPYRSVDELRSQMEKIMSEVERKGGRQNPYSPEKASNERRHESAANSSKSMTNSPEMKSERGDIQRPEQSESTVSEVTTTAPIEKTADGQH